MSTREAMPASSDYHLLFRSLMAIGVAQPGWEPFSKQPLKKAMSKS